MSIQQSNYLLLGFQWMIWTSIQIEIFHISNWTVNLNVVHDVENVAPVIGEKKKFLRLVTELSISNAKDCKVIQSPGAASALKVLWQKVSFYFLVVSRCHLGHF